MRAACERAVLALYELAEYVGLKVPDFNAVVVVGGCRLGPILEGPVAVSELRFRKDQPALGLREDSCVLLHALVEAYHQRSVKCVVLVSGIHYHRAVRRVQLALHGIHRVVLLLLRAEVGDYRPGLRVQPHRSLGIRALSDDLAVFLVAADVAVLVPAILEDLFHLRIDGIEVCDVIRVVLKNSILSQYLHGIYKLECDKCALALLPEPHAVVPVRMQSCRHSVVAEIVHREIDRSLQVVVNGALLHVVRVEDFFIEESDVAAFGDVLIYGREQPQRVVCAVRGVTGLLNVRGVVRRILMARIMRILYKRKACAVRYLRGEHEPDLVRCHLGSEVNDSLDILYGIAVTEAVPESAVLEGCGSGPGKCDEAVVSVPDVHHVVERLVRRMYLQVIEFCVPVCLQLFDFLLDYAVLLVLRDDFLRGLLGLLAEDIREPAGLARSKFNIALQRAAGVSAVIEVALQSFEDTDRVCVASVVTYELVAVAAVSVNLRTRKAEEALLVRVMEVLIFPLQNHVAAEIRMADEQRVLQVYLILLVVVVVYEFAVAGYGQLAGLIAGVRYNGVPDLVGGVLRHIISRLCADSLILRGNHRIRSSVAAFAFIAFKGFADRRPGSGPEVAVLAVTKIDVSAGLVKRHAVETVTDYPAVRAGFNEAVSARIVRDDGSVFRRSEIVSPSGRRIRTGDDVFFRLLIKITVVHGLYPFDLRIWVKAH